MAHLCSLCRSMKFRPPDFKFQHHQSIQILKVSAEDGCHLCTMLYHGIVHAQYLLGGKDETGDWCPAAEDDGGIILECINTSEHNETPHMLPGNIIRASCADRSLTLTLTTLDSRQSANR